MRAYIDKCDLLEWIKKVDGCCADGTVTAPTLYAQIISDIEQFPTADVADIIRCRDCAHWGGVTYGFVCRKFSGLETKVCMGANHYCSYGERKKSERTL